MALGKRSIIALNNVIPVTLLARDALLIGKPQRGKVMFFSLKKSLLLCLFVPLAYINSAGAGKSEKDQLLQKNLPGIGLAANLAISAASITGAYGVSLGIYALLMKRSYDAEIALQNQINASIEEGSVQRQPQESFASYFKRNLLSFNPSSATDWGCKVALPAALTAIALTIQYSPSRKKA